MSNLRNSWTLAGIALAVMALAAAPAPAGDHDPVVKHKKFEIKRIVGDCEGADCPEVDEERRVIMIGGDGEAHELSGHAMEWVGHDGAHAFALGHRGKGGFLGVATTELTAELRRHFGVPEEAGVLVAKVVDESAAANAGLQVGDILTAVDGAAIDSGGDLIRAIGKLEPGSAVNLELWRDGSLQTLGATLGERAKLRRQAMLLHCDDDGEDCPRIAHIEDLDCAGDGECEIRIECGDSGDCDCTVNGEPTECETLPGFAAPGD